MIKTADLVVNDWNPNRMTRFMRDKAVESIKYYGFIDPLTVFEEDGRYVIIDGEHRFLIGVEEFGMSEFPCVVLSGISREDAKKLTIVLNELHGQADPERLAELLDELVSGSSLEEVLIGLPFTPDVVNSFLDLPNIPDMPRTEKTEQRAAWVERLYRFPPDVVQVIDGAIARAQATAEVEDGQRIEPWQALERIAADYLAS